MGAVSMREHGEPAAGEASAASRSVAPAFSGDVGRVLALQRTAGNAVVGRLLGAGAGTRSLQRSCCGSCASGGSCESHEEESEVLARGRRALSASVAQRRAAEGRTLARYAHTDCTQDDLEKHVWPADYIARQMVKKAIKAISANPMDPAVTPLLQKYFMTATPKIAKMLKVLDKVDAEFRDNDYTYECENDCKPSLNGETLTGVVGALVNGNIHICMNNFRTRSNECLARTIVHEMTHRYANTDDNGYCKSGCDYSSCPDTLSADDALENADSFACFAYELYPMKLLTT